MESQVENCDQSLSFVEKKTHTILSYIGLLIPGIENLNKEFLYSCVGISTQNVD